MHTFLFLLSWYISGLIATFMMFRFFINEYNEKITIEDLWKCIQLGILGYAMVMISLLMAFVSLCSKIQTWYNINKHKKLL